MVSGGGGGDAPLDLVGVEIFRVSVIVHGVEEGGVSRDRICGGPSGHGGEGRAVLMVAEDASANVRVP